MKTLPLLLLLLAGCGTSSRPVASPASVAPRPSPSIPQPNTIPVADIQGLNWSGVHDTGTAGSSTGQTSIYAGLVILVDSPARLFQTTSQSGGGERYWVTFGSDPGAAHFIWDGWIYIEPGSQFRNLELDMNQVLANGDTVIFGFQCDGYSHTWDYSENTGTPAAPKGKWIHSPQVCDTAAWAQQVWHHIQIGWSRDGGNESCDYVILDGVVQPIGVSVPSEYASGWRVGVLLTNFQVDGTGTSELLLDDLTISRW